MARRNVERGVRELVRESGGDRIPAHFERFAGAQAIAQPVHPGALGVRGEQPARELLAQQLVELLHPREHRLPQQQRRVARGVLEQRR